MFQRGCIITNFFFFFFNDTATTEIYTLSLHDALPICRNTPTHGTGHEAPRYGRGDRSEEHTSEFQSRGHLVCRLLLEKKKTQKAKKETLEDINKSRNQGLLTCL